MQDKIITFAQEGESRIEISRSVFIGNSKEVSSAGEAEEFVSSIRAKYPDARHVCYAWRTSGDTFMQKYSDDGEPSGTGGMPILNVLTKKDITNAVITVTRYFGGILLGKGGLVRAYTEAASKAAEESGLVSIVEGEVYGVNAGYDTAEKIIFALKQDGWDVGTPAYGQDVSFEITCSSDRGEALKAYVTDKSMGKLEAVKIRDALIRKRHLT